MSLKILLLFFVFNGQMFLKNGKSIDYVGEYTINGPNVEFKRKNGSLYRLPVKIVDFKKTEAFSAKEKAAVAAKANQTDAQKAKAANKGDEFSSFVDDANADNRHKKKMKVKKKW